MPPCPTNTITGKWKRSTNGSTVVRRTLIAPRYTPAGVFGELRKVVNKPKEVPHLDKPEAQAKEAEDHRPVDGQGEDKRDTEGNEPPGCRHRPEEE